MVKKEHIMVFLYIKPYQRSSKYLPHEYVICICRGNISPNNKILTRIFKSEKRLFTKRSKMHRFIKGDLSEQS